MLWLRTDDVCRRIRHIQTVQREAADQGKIERHGYG